MLERILAENGIAVTDEQINKFALYREYLTEYNEKVNLTSITDPDGIDVKHFADSVLLLKYLDIPAGAAVCDVGTGAGFPGVPLLIMRNDIKLTLIEATAKKLVFVDSLLEKLGLSARCVHGRGEELSRLPEFGGRFDVVTARAVAALPKLAGYCLPLVKKGGVFAAMKGDPSPEELADGEKALAKLGGKIEKVSRYGLNGEKRCIMTVRKK
ncbi:MAG: 16S rRNA (guanine(527)-N(7))-methyltransferase RsmG [Clostridia bacterium]|nr:16S rRNA (guanine(527)-N(7))-methyltransferase RsmG [Clostridia bacterium]